MLVPFQQFHGICHEVADDIKINLKKTNDPSELRQQITKLIEVIKDLHKENKHLQSQNEKLKKKVGLSPLSPAAPSGVKPPAIKPQTSGTKKKPGANKKKKKPGRKPGFKGTSRKKPDEAEINGHKEHSLDECPQCGDKFERPTSQRQRIIIDTHIPKECDVTQHAINQYWCCNCRSMKEGTVTDAFPGNTIGIKASVYSAFLHYYLGMSISKVQSVLNISGLKVSSGALVNSWKNLAKSYTPFYNEILTEIRNTKGALHADETGYREHGQRRWLWTFCTKTAALFVIRPSRGSDVALEILGKSFGGILVTDFWKPYLSVIPRFHQWCVAHFLREFKKIEFRQDKPPPEYWKFRKKVMRLFKDALSFSKRRKSTAEERASAQKRFLKRLDDIVSQGHMYEYKDILRLVKRLRIYRDGFLTFVKFRNVDATNNHGERTIRFAVLIRKIQFHTMSAEGSATMEIMMSVFKTLDMRRQDVFQVALAMAKEEIAKNKYNKSGNSSLAA